MFFFFFYFHFRSPIIFTLTSQILVDFVLQLLFYLAFVLLYFLSYPLLFLLPDLLSSKSEIKANSFILFSSRHLLRQNTFKFFLFILLFMGKCFKLYFPNIYDFYLIAVLIFLSVFYRLMFSEHCSGFLFWPILLLLALKLARNEVWVAPRTVYSLRWSVETFSTFKDLLLF